MPLPIFFWLCFGLILSGCGKSERWTKVYYAQNDFGEAWKVDKPTIDNPTKGWKGN